MEDRPDLVLADEAIAVFVEDVECDSEIFAVQQSGAIYRRCDELLIVNLAIMVGVKLVNEVVPVLRAGSHGAQHLLHALLELVQRQEAVLGGVDAQEHLLHVD